MEVVMLERYFIRPQTIDRIRASWLGPGIEAYVSSLTEQEYSARSVWRRVPLLLAFGEFARERGARTYGDLPACVEPFAADWLKKRGTGRSPERLRHFADEVTNPVVQMLALLLPEYRTKRRRQRPQPFAHAAPGFFQYLREERGLREASIRLYEHHLRHFERYLVGLGLDQLEGISPVVLSAVVTERSQMLGTSSLTTLCSCLRVFLRYLHREDLLARDLSGSIESPQAYRLADLPRAISWPEVGRMLEAVDQRTVVGRRDYAILVLLVTYGLRAHEVAALTLDSLDWHRERLLVPERKAGHSTAYPLSPLVGEAILAYLKDGRPTTDDRHLFFRVQAPHTALSPVAVSIRASVYLHEAGIQVGRPGSHTLRHTCVTRLVAADFPLKTIGDYVGHRSPNSTAIYGKVALERLREVALGDGEEVLG
jgi:integrase/recombinase XerD